MTGTQRPVREVKPNTVVIYAAQDGEFRYEGPNDDRRFATIAFSYGSKLNGLKCDPRLVAPADTPIPAASDRVNVVKQARGYYPTHTGPWLLYVDGKSLGYHKTKRDATADGLRTVAILDWHASTAEPTSEASATDDELAQLEQRIADELFV